ncbi:MAG: FAD-binding oxidoreductase [Anaerolineales bacterium]
MKVIIVGGGIQGLACAFALKKRGVGPITILEANRIGYGASCRCGGGIRAQFHNASNIKLAKRSIELFEKLTAELQYHIMFHHGGYMYLHYNDTDAAQAEQDVKLQNHLGVPSKLISPKKAARIVPSLNADGVIVVQYNAQDAVCHHDALLWAYVRALRKSNITIQLGMKVSKIEIQGGRATGVIANDRFIPGEQIIVATGSWTKEIMKTIGVNIPVSPWKRETLVTMPVRHFLDPLVIDNRRNIYIHQTLRGEILGGASVPQETPTTNWDATRSHLEIWCKGIYDLFPPLGQISIIRQWAGTRSFTPDGSPIFGPVKNIGGLWTICGQSGTGLMLAPAIAESIALALVGKHPHVNWSLYSPDRFTKGQELWERTPQI